jgi:hypothetical protein
MGFHRGLADVQPPGDVVVGQPGGDQADDFALAGGEFVQGAGRLR